MSETMKTTLFVLIAAALLALSLKVAPGTREPALFDDEGEEFFPEFTNPDQAHALEVVEYREASSEPSVFKVEKKDGVWAIPSHHGYPADAEDRMAKAAGLVIGLRKGSIRSDLPADHAGYGVVDPMNDNPEPGTAGKLVSFLDEGGNTLASLVVGKTVGENTQKRYVRVPDKKRTYIAELPAEITTAFKDWIDTELLDLDSWKLSQLFFDNYSIDEVRGVRTPGEQIVLKKPDIDWELDGINAELEEVQKDRVTEVGNTLANLKIVGVRPKPSGLSAQLAKGGNISLNAQDVFSLQSRGFYILNGAFHANEGDLHASTKDGIVYTLRFGEVLFGVGEDVTAGSVKEGTAEFENPTDAEGVSANRFLMTTASFDPDLLEKPDGTPLPKEHLDMRELARNDIDKIKAAIETYKGANDNNLPETLAELTEGENPPLDNLPQDPWGMDYVYSQVQDGGFVIASYADDKSEGGTGIGTDIASDRLIEEDELKSIATKFEEYEKKVAEGQKTVETLSQRFAPWYYVIDDESFKKLHLSRDQVVKPIEKGDASNGDAEKDG